MSDETHATDMQRHTPRTLRLLLGKTQEQLAGEAGVSVPTLATIESGDRRTTIASLAKVAAALRVSEAQLLDAMDRASQNARTQ